MLRSRFGIWPILAVLVAGGPLGCAPSRAPATAASPSAAPTPTPAEPPQTVNAAEDKPTSTAELVPARLHDTKPIVIDEGGDDAQGPGGLVAAAAAERQRRARAGNPTVVINDKNLPQHATGKLTVSQAPAAPKRGDTDKPSDPEKGEQYWRDRVRTLRQQWALSVDAITELQERAAGLRTRFYAEADPYVRDGQIKPSWDKALENLQAARERARSLEEQLAQALEDGRIAGAQPGWLRDGVDLEPKERPYDEPAKKPPHDDGVTVKEPEDLGKPPGR